MSVGLSLRGSVGSAYVFSHLNDGIWTQQSKLVASDGRSGDYFGGSVSNSGNLVAIGAIGHDIGGLPDVGKTSTPAPVSRDDLLNSQELSTFTNPMPMVFGANKGR